MIPNTKLFIPVTSQAGIGNTLKGLITALTITNDVVIECNKKALLGDYSDVLDELHINNAHGRESFQTSRFHVLKEEELEQKSLPNEIPLVMRVDLDNPKFHYLFSTTVKIDWNYDRSLICDKVYNRFMNGIDKIRWNDTVLTEVNKYSNLITPNTLGVSVRSWTAPHEHNINRVYSPSLYNNTIKRVIEENAIKTVFMSYDNINIKNDYTETIGGYNVIEYIKPSYISELQYAVIKMLLLSKCTYFICNRMSTYSELVFWFSRCTQYVIPLL